MIEKMIADIAHLLTPAGLLALVNVILIDIVMSGDNAIVIGLATRDLPEKDRRRVIMIGVALATILRIIFACTAVFLMKTIGLKFAGGILLLYVVWKFYKELRTEKNQEAEAGVVRTLKSLWGAVWLIVLADVSMSLDNVLAVAGASRESLLVLGIGLVVSILLMALASGYIARKMARFPQIQWLGLLIVLFVAIEMLLAGGRELETHLFHVNILPVASLILGIVGFQLHAKYVKPNSDRRIARWFAANWRGVFLGNLFLFLALCFLGDKIKRFLFNYPALLYFLLAVVLGLVIEILATFRSDRKEAAKPD
jgi:YjbE family integral membrane protein